MAEAPPVGTSDAAPALNVNDAAEASSFVPTPSSRDIPTPRLVSARSNRAPRSIIAEAAGVVLSGRSGDRTAVSRLKLDQSSPVASWQLSPHWRRGQKSCRRATRKCTPSGVSSRAASVTSTRAPRGLVARHDGGGHNIIDFYATVAHRGGGGARLGRLWSGLRERFRRRSHPRASKSRPEPGRFRRREALSAAKTEYTTRYTAHHGGACLPQPRRA